MTDLALRPRSATEIIDLAVRLLRRHFRALVTIALVGVIPVLVVQVALTSMLTADPTRVVEAFTSYGLLSWLVLFVLRSFMVTALTIGADDALRTRGAVDAADALRRSGGRIGTVVGVSLLSFVATAIGFVFLFVPGVYVALRLATAVPVAALEEVGVVEALRRAWDRSDGHLLHTCKVVLLLVLIFMVFGIAVSVVAGLSAAAFGGAGTGWPVVLAVQGVSTLLSAAIDPLLTNTLLLLSYDLRVRREGYDVEAMVASLGAVP